MKRSNENTKGTTTPSAIDFDDDEDNISTLSVKKASDDELKMSAVETTDDDVIEVTSTSISNKSPDLLDSQYSKKYM